MEPRTRGLTWMDRRTFLRGLGAGLATAAGASLVLQAQPPSVAAQAVDPALFEVARSLDFDQARIHRWVTDEVRYEPYLGALRGSRGTLAAMAGNSVDQALLLSELLAASGIVSRIRLGVATDAALGRLRAATSVTFEDEMARAVRTMTGRPAPGPAPTVDQAVLDRLTELAESGDSTTVADGTDALREMVDLLDRALVTAGVELPDDPLGPEVEAGHGHAWVQARSGAAWIDLDPSVPGALAGEAFATSETDGTAGAEVDGLRHRVEMAVIVERLTGGALVRSEVATLASTVDALIGEPLLYLHATPDGLAAIGASIGRALEGVVQYFPSFVVGEHSWVSDDPIVFGGGGNVLSSPDDGPIEGEATAEWLEIRVATPDGRTKVARRTVFDRVGSDEARTTFDPATLAPVELVALEAGGDLEFLPCCVVHGFGVAGGDVGARWFADRPRTGEGSDLIGFVPTAAHFLRDVAAVELATAFGVRPFTAGATVMDLVLTPRIGADGREVLHTALDIWHRDLGALLVADRPLIAPPGLVAGVLSHVAEHLLYGPTSAAMTDPGMSVIRVFRAAAEDGIEPVVLTARAAVEALPVDAAVRRRLVELVDAGMVVVTPARPVRLDDSDRTGWWIVDPVTGATADELDTGGGSELAEYELPLTTSGRIFTALERLAACIAQVILACAFWIGAAKVVVGGTLGMVLKVLAELLTYLRRIQPVLAGLCR